MKIKTLDLIFFVLYFLLVIFQIITTNVKTAYSYTPAEIDFQIQRMNMYPHGFGRIGKIMETNNFVQILEKVQNNFFTVVDFREYFPNRLPYVLSPFVLVGLYIFVKERRKRKIIFYSFLLSIFILTVIGPNAKYGPVLMYPYFLLFVILCLKKLF